MHDIDKDRIEYTVREPRWAHIIAALYLLMAVIITIGIALTWHEGEDGVISNIFLCSCLLIPGLLIVLGINQRCLFVLDDGQEYIYRTMFGRRTHFAINEISCVMLEKSIVRGECLRILHIDKHVLCILERNMVPIDRLISGLEGKGITVVEIDEEKKPFGELSPRQRAEKERILSAMTDVEYEEYARGTKRLHTASKIMQIVSVILAVFMIRSRAISFDQMSLVFVFWPIVFLIFGILGRHHYSIYDASDLRKHGATERYIETVVPFPFIGMLSYAALSMMPGLLINGVKEWDTICFGLLEMAIVLLVVFPMIRRRISVLATVLLVPLVLSVTFSHAIHLNWSFGTRHTEVARVERTEVVKFSRGPDEYHIYVDDGNGQTVRYNTTHSIVNEKQAGDTVTLLINESVFGIRQVVVKK